MMSVSVRLWLLLGNLDFPFWALGFAGVSGIARQNRALLRSWYSLLIHHASLAPWRIHGRVRGHIPSETADGGHNGAHTCEGA